MFVYFPSEDLILAMHAESINHFGGSHGLRDENLLRSALDRAVNRAYYEPDTSVARLAASLGWGLIKNHVFIDGNKRIGLAAVLVFLGGNGVELSCSREETEAMVLQVAASEIDEAAWTAWLERVAVPR